MAIVPIRKPEPDDEDEEEKPPVEPNGKELTDLRKRQQFAREKMQGTFDEIVRLLQDEQRRQNKHRGKDAGRN